MVKETNNNVSYVQMDRKKPTLKKIKRKCIVCMKNLKVTELNLCSCKRNVCMKHRGRNSHMCELNLKTIKMEKIVAIKVNKI